MSRSPLPPRRDGVLILAMVGVLIAGLTAGGLLFYVCKRSIHASGVRTMLEGGIRHVLVASCRDRRLRQFRIV